MLNFGCERGFVLRIASGIVASLILFVGLSGAIPVEEWNKTFGGSGSDYASSAIKITDGYMIAGSTDSYGTGNNAWLIKIDVNGNEVWTRTYGEGSIFSVLQLFDGFILAGDSQHRAMLIKTDLNGNKLWNRSFGEYSSFSSVLKTTDGYVLAGQSSSISFPWGGAWLVKTDLNGNEIWNRSLGARKTGSATSIQQTLDGYIIAATFVSMGGGSDGRLIKTNFDGIEIWNRTFKGYFDGESFSSVQITPDGYIISGKIRTVPLLGYNAWLIKTDKNGIEVWNRTLGSQNGSSASSVQITPNGYIIAGSLSAIPYSGNDYSDVWLLETDKNGNELWNKTFDKSNYDSASSLLPITDGYLISGKTDSVFCCSPDAWIIKTKDTALPAVINPSASHEIPDDTDKEPMWGETAQLNVTVTDNSGIASVTVDLSGIGGSSKKSMINTGGNIWSTTTNAFAGTPPGIYNLRVNATNTYGISNTGVTIPLKVMKNGDTTGNNAVNIGDALRLANNVSFSGNPAYTLSSIYVADVNGNGVLNIGDALRLANNVSFPGNPAYILK